MLSILIPIYNIAVGQLIKDLTSQADATGVDYEVICLDDASESSTQVANETIQNIRSVIYERLPNNIGRSRIRNLLARKAKYSNLLFLDCDAKIYRSDFVQKYLDAINDSQVLVGGRTYPDKPADKTKQLHWKFGTVREQGNNSAFQSNNFVIPRSLMLRYPFDESIVTYGHEDTLLGFQLSQMGVIIKHINNPVLHDDLITVEDFLSKQRDALANLMVVTDRFPDISTRFTRTIGRLDKWHLSPILRFFRPTIQAFCQKQLIAGSTSLRLLDLYKICWYLDFTGKSMGK